MPRLSQGGTLLPPAEEIRRRLGNRLRIDIADLWGPNSKTALHSEPDAFMLVGWRGLGRLTKDGAACGLL